MQNHHIPGQGNKTVGEEAEGKCPSSFGLAFSNSSSVSNAPFHQQAHHQHHITPHNGGQGSQPATPCGPGTRPSALARLPELQIAKRSVSCQSYCCSGPISSLRWHYCVLPAPPRRSADELRVTRPTKAAARSWQVAAPLVSSLQQQQQVEKSSCRSKSDAGSMDCASWELCGRCTLDVKFHQTHLQIGEHSSDCIVLTALRPHTEHARRSLLSLLLCLCFARQGNHQRILPAWSLRSVGV